MPLRIANSVAEPFQETWPKDHHLVGARQGCSAKQLDIVPVPIALESFVGIVLLFQLQEFRELRVTRFYLLARCPTVVGQVKPPVILDHPVNDTTKVCLGLGNSLGRVGHMQVADDTD